MVTEFVAAVVVAYFLGSIPFGLIIGRLAKGVDIRRYGSGKTGATNLMRVAGARLGILTIVLDVVKGGAAVVLAGLIVDNSSEMLTIGNVYLSWHHLAQTGAGLAAVIGHNWPVFANFRGGRGVTAYFGTLFAIYPPVGIFGAEVVAIAALRSRQMSMGSILGAIASWCLMVPLTIVYDFPPIYLAYGLVVTTLLLFQHHDNIRRIRQGTERRLW